MSEIKIPKIEKQDIAAPAIEPGGTAIVMQRHEKYSRDRSDEMAGSINNDAADLARQRDLEFFQDVIAQESDGVETMVFFVSSDTQYAGKGRRSLETAQLAEDAAAEAFTSKGIDPTERVINFNPSFMTSKHEETDQSIRPMKGLREPKIFDVPEYVSHLRDMYGVEAGDGPGLSQAAWAAHEADTEKELREELGAEGVYDILDRTKQSVRVFERYSKAFHALNPHKRLVIWAATHYDTISPLVKDATNTSFEEYVPVDYGAGIVLNIAPESRQVQLQAQSEEVILNLGRISTGNTKQ